MVELGGLSKSYAEAIDRLRENNGSQSASIPKSQPMPIFSQIDSRIGLLSVEEIKLVMRAYWLASELPKRLGLLQSAPAPPEYIILNKAHIRTALKTYTNFKSEIDAAYENFQKMVSQSH